jgi:DnaJ family protein C protein 19
MGWLVKAALAVMIGALIYRWLKERIKGVTRMPAAEARALLGVSDSATLGDIRDAHRRLISRVHPDAGGSAELATRVNAARDALVSELNRRPPSAS